MPRARPSGRKPRSASKPRSLTPCATASTVVPRLSRLVRRAGDGRDPAGPLASPVTDAARAASAASAAALPDVIHPGAAPVLTIDALGRKCPIPIIWLAQQIGDVPVGAVIAVLADDPAAYSDIPAWSAQVPRLRVPRRPRHRLVRFGIRRRY